MKANERNLIRSSHIVQAEFEIARKEDYEEKRGIRKFFARVSSDLDYTSFLKGFVHGALWQKRGHLIVEGEKENKEQSCKKGYGSHDYAVWNTDRKVFTCINCGKEQEKK